MVCLRGASAVQEILNSRGGLRVRVFVVWEPVIATDLAPPTTGTLARIHDRRAVQYWDHDRALSADIVRSVLADPDRYGLEKVEAGSIVWDTVAVFPPDVRWEAYFIPPERLIQLLQTIASGESYNLPPLPPDTQVMDAFYDSERAAFVLFLESSFFDRANVESEGGDTHLGMPERYLNLTRDEKPT